MGRSRSKKWSSTRSNGFGPPPQGVSGGPTVVITADAVNWFCRSDRGYAETMVDSLVGTAIGHAAMRAAEPRRGEKLSPDRRVTEEDVHLACLAAEEARGRARQAAQRAAIGLEA